MRRTILIIINSIYHVCTALWIGSIIGIGAMAAPVTFADLGRSPHGPAGLIIGHAFRRLNAASAVFLVLMLAAAVFEMFYRKRATTRRLLLARTLLTVVGVMSVAFLGLYLMPQMELARSMDNISAFDRMHAFYRQVAFGQVFLGIALIVLTNAVNIGPRRDGGHPRNV